jgi:hypothetical protein
MIETSSEFAMEFEPLAWSTKKELCTLEPVFLNLLRGPGIDSQSGGLVQQPYSTCRTFPPELEFFKNLWGLGTE